MSWPDGASIEGLAAELGAMVEEIARVNELEDDARIDVVAHSMGGIVARFALDDPAVARRVSTVVTLGTPHHGTLAARYAGGAHTLTLRPGSPLFARLAHQVPWPASMPRLVCFWSQDDVFLLPHETGFIEGAHAIEMERYTHLTYLLHPACFQRVREVLSDDRG
jgi:pimeloyl-ACP methyl ester carboxylesterase